MSVPVDPVDAIANAVLYEGYLLYPYRQSSVKNQVRWTFGGVHPKAWSEATGGSEPWLQQTQCLVTAGDGAAEETSAVRFPAGCRVKATVRFLRLMECRRPGLPAWQEATEFSLPPLDLDLQSLIERPIREPVELAGGCSGEDEVQREWRPLSGVVEAEAEPAAAGAAVRLTLRALNTTVLPEPTSPWISRLIRSPAARSARISPRARSWAPVKAKGRSARIFAAVSLAAILAAGSLRRSALRWAMASCWASSSS